MPTIVVADDEQALRDMYRMQLTRDGYTVYDAIDGPDAVEKILELHPDAIILDVMMPKMNGLDVLKLIRSDAKTRSTPVLLLTALSQDLREIASASAQACLSKAETTPREVSAKLRELLAANLEPPQKMHY